MQSVRTLSCSIRTNHLSRPNPIQADAYIIGAN